jgi:transposase
MSTLFFSDFGLDIGDKHKRRRFTREFKLQVLREIEAGKSIAQAAREHELHPNLITRWRSLQSEYAQQPFGMNPYLETSS